MEASGWYNPLPPSCTVQLDTSTVKKPDHTTGSPSQDEQLSEPLCQKMMEENTSPIDKGQWKPHSANHPIVEVQ